MNNKVVIESDLSNVFRIENNKLEIDLTKANLLDIIDINVLRISNNKITLKPAPLNITRFEINSIEQPIVDNKGVVFLRKNEWELIKLYCQNVTDLAKLVNLSNADNVELRNKTKTKDYLQFEIRVAAISTNERFTFQNEYENISGNNNWSVNTIEEFSVVDLNVFDFETAVLKVKNNLLNATTDAWTGKYHNMSFDLSDQHESGIKDGGYDLFDDGMMLHIDREEDTFGRIPNIKYTPDYQITTDTNNLKRWSEFFEDGDKHAFAVGFDSSEMSGEHKAILETRYGSNGNGDSAFNTFTLNTNSGLVSVFFGLKWYRFRPTHCFFCITSLPLEQCKFETNNSLSEDWVKYKVRNSWCINIAVPMSNNNTITEAQAKDFITKLFQ